MLSDSGADRIALLVVALTFLAGGCIQDAELRLSPAQVAVDDWDSATLLLSGLHPSLYLNASGNELVAVDDLRVRVGAASTRIVSVDGAGVTVQLLEPLEIGEHVAVLRADGVDYVASPALSVGDGGGTVLEPGWTRRRRLTFDNSRQDQNLIEFTVLVALTSERVDYGAAGDGGAALRFVAPDEATVLAHEIESWDPGGVSSIWVSVPMIVAGSSTDHIWMYYGNPDAADGQDALRTWNHSCLGVWHLHSDVDDSTRMANDGTAEGIMPDGAMVADGRRVDGISGGIDVGDDESINDVFATGGTLSAWIFADGWGGGGYGRILDKSASRVADEGWGWQLQENNATGLHTLRFERSFNRDGMTAWVAEPNAIELGRWHHIALTFDERDAQAQMYVDGRAVPVSADGIPGGRPESDSLQPMRIGNRSNRDDRAFDGVIDEVRVSDGVRTAAELAAQYASETGTFVTYGPEQSL